MAKSRAVNATPKRKAKKAAAPELPAEITIDLGDINAMEPIVTSSGAMEIPTEDGGVVIDFSPPVRPGADIEGARKKHDANLAEVLDDRVLQHISSELLEGIEADDNSRQDWLGMRTRGLDMLAIKLEQPRTGLSGGAAPLEGMSVYRDPTLSAALLRFQAEAQGELLPASGPVKVVDYGDQDFQNMRLAERLEKDLNFYLTTTASEYYPDTGRMFWETGFSGLAFKKVYRDPLKRRPVSETVPPEHLIVSDAITDLRSAKRITHVIEMKPSVMKRMQIVGVYRDTRFTGEPNYQPNQYDEKVGRIEGIDFSGRPEDKNYEVLECYCELDIEGFEHEGKNGKPSGLPLPYRVTIERESREILEIRRNWKQDDEDFIAKIPFVAFPYATGPGFWGVGLLHLLGNPTMAITALTREAIDAGMFANFPGFLVAKSATRQMSNEFRVAPGSGVPIDTNGMPIKDAVMELPYREAGPAHMSLIDKLTDRAEKLGNTANTPVGEGKANAPVGTTLALIEQATKVEGAVMKRMMAAQSEEFLLLMDLFRDDPEALWRGNRRPALGKDKEQRLQLFEQALNDCDIVPKADPNVPSRIQRLAVAETLRKMAADRPNDYDLDAVDRRVLSVLGIENPDELFRKTPVAAAGPDPIEVAKIQVENRKVDAKEMEIALKAQNEKANRESKQNIEVLKLAQTVGVHPEANAIVDEQIMQLAPLMTNIVPTMLNPQTGGAVHRPVPVPGLGGIGRPPMQFSPPPPRRPMQPIPNGAMS